MRRILVLTMALMLLLSSAFLRPLGAENAKDPAGEMPVEETLAEREAEHAGMPKDHGDTDEPDGLDDPDDADAEEQTSGLDDSKQPDGLDDAEQPGHAEEPEQPDEPEGTAQPDEPETAADEKENTKEDPADESRESETLGLEESVVGTKEVPADLEGTGSDGQDETSLPGIGEDGPEAGVTPEETAEEEEETGEKTDETETPKKAGSEGTRAVTYRVTVRFRANGGSIDTPAENDSTVYPIYRVSSSTDRVQIKRSKTGSWTNYTEVVTTDETYHNLINVAEMGLYRTGYHVVSGRAYNTKADATGLRISQVNTSSSSTNPATAVRLNGGEPVTADKTVDIYVEWIADSCTIVIHSNGGSWYQPSQGEPAGALGTPAGSGTDRTYTRTLKYQDTVVLHNTFAELLTDYYIRSDFTQDDIVIPEDTGSRWLTWFTREGYVFQGWNTQADANGSPTSRYPGRNVLDGGKMLTTAGALSTAAANNFGETTSLTMSKLGASNGDTIHLYAQWRKRVTVSAGELSSGVRINTEGFAYGSSLYDGLELMIPSLAPDTAEKVEAGGSSDFVWQVKNGAGRFYFQQALTKNVPYVSDSTLWVLFKDRAYDIYGTTYDVKVILSDITLKAARNIDAGSANIFRVDMENGEVQCAVYPLQTGASYKVTVRILESGTGREVTGMRSMMLLRDMDIPDRIAGLSNYQYRWNDGTSSVGTYTSANGRVPAIYPFAEAVRIPASTIAAAYTRAAGKNLYVQQDNSVVVSEIQGGVHVTGSEYTGSQSSEFGHVLQRDSYKAGVAFPVITGNVELVWTGNACGTTLFEDGEMNRITSEVVEDDGVTLVNGGAGDPEECGTITFGGQGPRTYPFNSSAVYSMTPAEDHKVSRVWLDIGEDHGLELTVDGEEHTVEGIGTYRISEEGGSFTFVGIVADHDIRVSFVRSWPKTGTLTVQKIVTGSMGSRDKVFHFTVRLSHELGYDNYPEEGITARLNDGEEQVLTPAFDPGEPGCAILTFTLTHGDVMTLTGLWEGTSYSVTEAEADRDGYSTAYKNETGVIIADQTAAVTVTNDRDMPVPTGVSLPEGLPVLCAGLAGLAGLRLRRRRR